MGCPIHEDRKNQKILRSGSGERRSGEDPGKTLDQEIEFRTRPWLSGDRPRILRIQKLEKGPQGVLQLERLGPQISPSPKAGLQALWSGWREQACSQSVWQGFLKPRLSRPQADLPESP